MYTFLRATKNRFEPVRNDSVACGFKRFFISEKPELQLTVRFFCGSVRFSCGFFRLCEPNLQTQTASGEGIPIAMQLEAQTAIDVDEIDGNEEPAVKEGSSTVEPSKYFFFFSLFFSFSTD